MKRKRINWKPATLALLLAAGTASESARAQDKVEASVGADLVSSYIWRGQDLGDVSLQPSLSIAYKGFSLGAWGSVGFEGSDTKEVDLTLGYARGGFSISVTDYWFDNGPGYFHFKAHDTSHVFEAQVGYDFGVLSLNWYTNFAGNDGVNADGRRAYSSYVAVVVPFRLGGLEWTAEAGAVPWATTFYNGQTNGFSVCNVSLGAAKEIRLTDRFSLPLFAKVTWNPRTEGTHFVIGLSL